MPFLAAGIAALTGSASFLGVAAATSVFGIATGTVGFAALQIGAGLLLNAAIASANRPSQADVVSNLSFPTSRPVYRHILGKTVTNCTPLPSPVVGSNFYGVYLVQSRVTDGEITLLINDQEVPLEGDPYDFSGSGATASSGPFQNYINVFIGRGDQTSPPQLFLDDAPYDVAEDDADLRFRATDAGTGNTIIFIKMAAGPSESRSRRWGGGIPRVSVTGQLTNVFDPRDAAQSISDPSTWGYSDNQSLLVLDALINNPFRPYREIHLDLQSFSDAADVADQLVPTKDGGTIKRYRAAGVVTFDSTEIEDIVEPIARAGASRMSRIGGVLGIVPAIWTPPTHTITDSLGGISFSNDNFQGDAPTETRAEYTPETRPLESAETPVYRIAGALEENGGEEVIVSFDLGWVPDHRQAQRVNKILALRSRQGKTISLVGRPSDLILIAGENANLQLQEPFGTYMNGIYEVESIGAGTDPLGETGLALRSNISLRSTSQAIYDWNAATEEQDVYDPVFDAELNGVLAGGPISITTGNTVNDSTGDTVIPRALFEFDPSPSAGVVLYEYQFARQADPYSQTSFIEGETRNPSGNVFGYFSGEAGVEYKLRVRAVDASGASDWIEFENITLVVDIELTPPNLVSATGNTNEIDVLFVPSNDPDLEFTEIWAGDTNLIGDATLIHVSYVSQGQPTFYTETGLGSLETRYYFGRTRGPFNSASDFTASVSATTN